MSFFGSLRLRSRLFLLVLLLVAINAATGWYLITALKGQEKAIEELYGGGMEISKAAEVNVGASGLLTSMYSTFNSPEVIWSGQALIMESMLQNLERAISGYEEITVIEGNKARWDETAKTFAEWSVGVREVIELFRNEAPREEVSKKIDGIYLSTNALSQRLGEIFSFSQIGLDTISSNATSRLNEAIKTSTIAMAIAAAAALILGFLVAGSTTKPLKKLVTSVQNIAEELDLTARGNSKSRDETGDVSRSLDYLLERFSEALKEVSGVSLRVAESAENFSASSEETSANLQEVKSSAEAMAAQVENLAAGVEEINASVEEVAAGAQTAAQRSQEVTEEVEMARGAGEDGIRAVQNAVAASVNVADGALKASNVVSELAERAKQIQSFVDVIGSIADQTNLLALNAAIEAARAGEHGRGFAVVAEEVRKLAEASNEAALKIADLAQTIVADLGEVVDVTKENARMADGAKVQAQEAESAISRIMEALKSITAAAQDMAALAEEQAASSEEIASTVQNMAERTQDVASAVDSVHRSIEEVAQASRHIAEGSSELADLAGKLQGLVRQFKIEKEEEKATEETIAEAGLVPVS
ncbi:MAG TPA: HAMP domain-containing methyl-accepting chemotaxis protein [Thermosynergistes sp.]|nr:HAMP domain-containing methyl-accepting chemotaxis protein [Thermosynergistes sp.]